MITFLSVCSYFISVQILILKGNIFKWSKLSNRLISIIFSLKFLIIAGFVYFLNQHPQYDLKHDHNNFIEDAQLLANVFHHDPIEYFKLLTGTETSEVVEKHWLNDTHLWFTSFEKYNDSRPIIRFHSIISLLPFQNEYLHLLVIVLISTLSTLLLVRAFHSVIHQQKIFFLFLSFGLPIYLIYGNLIQKEHVLILGLALTCYGLSMRKIKSYHLWLGVFFLLIVKFYVLIAFILSLVLFCILRIRRKKLQAIAFGFSILSGVLIYSSSLTDKVAHLITTKQYAFKNVATKGLYLYEPGRRDNYYYLAVADTIKFTKINSNQLQAKVDVKSKKIEDNAKTKAVDYQIKAGQIFDISMVVDKTSTTLIHSLPLNSQKQNLIVYLPEAIRRGLFTPTFFSPGSNAKIPAILEMMTVWLFFLFGCVYGFIHRPEKWKYPIGISLLFFVLLIGYLVGINTPIIGAIVRYRIPAYLAIIILSFILIDPLWKRKLSSSPALPRE